MSISNPNNHQFATPQSLSDWLRPRLPSDSFASWGVTPGTKNVDNLWLEISEGETSLADSTPPIRTVNVVTVRVIGKNNLILLESHQELSDGSVRDRCKPLSEKMKPNETPQAAVFRAIKEELGSILNDAGAVTIVPGSYKEKLEERNSVSYPGLPARYVLHTVDVVVDGLPEGDFCTEEAEEYADSEEKRAAERAVSVKRHFWKWVSPESLQSS
uniref:Nudix hydrolase domain-containing protein n=1 Tax=Rhizophora mucronata TaxID=61149 RepID=A0A2P2PRU6_RHIMU